MPTFHRITIAIKALRQLGFTPLALNALYRLGLKTGHFKRVENRRIETSHLFSTHLFSIPDRQELLAILGKDGLQTLLTEADEIVAGKVRLFGAKPVDLNLTPAAPLAHWTDYETGKATFNLQPSDIKLIWEPARFGWAFVLGRAWHITGDEKYAEAFWRHFETFNASNPPYLGPNWMSGQEVGIRLMAFVWARQVFANSEHSTSTRLAALAASTALHAARIPATLLYARSQNNNHLLTEAAALYTASLALPDHPDASKWQALGQQWLTWCFTHQIDAYGEYIQHSTNYQRLMLQTALWVNVIARSRNAATWQHRARAWVSPIKRENSPGYRRLLRREERPPRNDISQENLALATHWLLSLLDTDSGQVPNLGANDGALIFPLSTCEFSDYRPVIQAAARAFLETTLPSGPWDEMALWFSLPRTESHFEIPRYISDHIYAPNFWGYLRAVKFKSRPSHADQLHLDIWWRGLNIAQDAGTYLYNAPPPWDNRLTSTLIHNTVSVDGQEQMTRVSRFLYLDWVDATNKRYFETDADYSQRVSASTDAYARLNVRHERVVTVYDDDRWVVEDELLNVIIPGITPAKHVYRLHWLLPDWEYELENREERVEIRLKSPHGWIRLEVNLQPSTFELSTTLSRAGEVLHGAAAPDPVRGWVSPTYAHKVPALSLAVEVESAETIKFISEFRFPTVDRRP